MTKLILTVLLAGTSLFAHAEQPRVAMGNGADNWIMTDGASREGERFTFSEVKIAGPGWLVMHPFRDGKPDGKVVAGYTAVPAGISTDVSLSVSPAPDSGDKYIVMLHSDANENGAFDFVFVNEREVVDAAVFEGSTMIGHVFVSP